MGEIRKIIFPIFLSSTFQRWSPECQDGWYLFNKGSSLIFLSWRHVKYYLHLYPHTPTGHRKHRRKRSRGTQAPERSLDRASSKAWRRVITPWLIDVSCICDHRDRTMDILKPYIYSFSKCIIGDYASCLWLWGSTHRGDDDHCAQASQQQRKETKVNKDNSL